jgi:nitrogen PTS system EIIA component
MKIMTFVTEDRVTPDLHGTDKLAVLRELSRPLVKACGLGSVEALAQVLLEREKIESTGIGDGVAIPHGRVRGLKDFVLSVARSTKGIEFDSIDHKPVHLFFLVLAPENSASINLELLSRIVTLLRDSSFKKRLMEARSSKELFQVISEEDEKY